MPAEDQRAAEGADRPQVVASKVVPMLDGQDEGRVRRAQERARGAGEEAGAAGQQLALSVNNCDREPAADARARARQPAREGQGSRAGLPRSARPAGADHPRRRSPGRRRSGRRTVLAELDRVEGQPVHRPRVRQPRVAVPLRPRASCPARTTSASSANSRRTPNCSTGSRASSWPAAGSSSACTSSS